MYHCRCICLRQSVRLGLLSKYEQSARLSSIIASMNNKSYLSLMLRRTFRLCASNQTELHHKTVATNTSSNRNIEEIKQKLLFNSVLEKEYMKFGRVRQIIKADKEKREQYKKLCDKSVNDLPISLRYMPGYEDLFTSSSSVDGENSDVEESGENYVQLPYRISVDANKPQESTQVEDVIDVNEDDGSKGSGLHGNWMTDYELYDESLEGRGSWPGKHGTPDPAHPVTKVACGGCGARLHCQDTAIPGYLPSELLKGRTRSELSSMVCQRCHFLRHYNTALQVSVKAEEYPRILGQIRERRALVVLLVDLMDVPCSIWPGMLDIIGTKRPVVVVGNKVDLLPRDCRGYLHNIERALLEIVETSGLSRANVKHVALVSAKTGFGVESLITKLHNHWENKGDVYLVGCTNTGKSTLFNALLQSDYCKVQAVDLLQRATTSPWPGTTLNLLKFPILRPSAWRLYARTRRLVAERGTEELRLAAGRGLVGRTFTPPQQQGADPAGRTGINVYSDEYRESRWCYDTPGVVHEDQLINMLTTEELMLTLPKTPLTPRTFNLGAGCTLFIASLARLDVLAAEKPVRLTVFASNGLPITVCRTPDADEVYSRLIGSELMAVPMGGAERLKQWPGLAEARAGVLQLVGVDWKRSCGDVVLSSSGWVSVTPGPDVGVDLRAWTPGGRGVHVRPSLLAHAVNHRGARIRRSPAYKPASVQQR